MYTDIFAHKVKPEFVFHNLDHTEDVAEASSQMADYYQLNDERPFCTYCCLPGFMIQDIHQGKWTGHEEESVQIATQFLQRTCCMRKLMQQE